MGSDDSNQINLSAHGDVVIDQHTSEREHMLLALGNLLKERKLKVTFSDNDKFNQREIVIKKVDGEIEIDTSVFADIVTTQQHVRTDTTEIREVEGGFEIKYYFKAVNDIHKLTLVVLDYGKEHQSFFYYMDHMSPQNATGAHQHTHHHVPHMVSNGLKPLSHQSTHGGGRD